MFLAIFTLHAQFEKISVQRDSLSFLMFCLKQVSLPYQQKLRCHHVLCAFQFLKWAPLSMYFFCLWTIYILFSIQLENCWIATLEKLCSIDVVDVSQSIATKKPFLKSLIEYCRFLKHKCSCRLQPLSIFIESGKWLLLSFVSWWFSSACIQIKVISCYFY